MQETPGTRGIGAVLLAAVAVMFAQNAGMSGRHLWAIGPLVGLGSALLVTGRWSGW